MNADKRLNIALIDDSFYPMVDGVANAVYNYAKYLSKKHDVTVFTSTPRLPLSDEKFPFKVVRCKSRRFVKFGDYSVPKPNSDPNFLKAIDRKFDIIHLHSPAMLAHLGVKVAKKYHTPLIYTLHTQFDLELKERVKSRTLAKLGVRFIGSFFIKAVDEMWVMHEGTEALARRYYYKGPTFRIQNGCDFFPKKVSIKKLNTLRLKYAKKDEKVLLYVGRLSRLKNLKFIIQVCAALRDLNYPFKLLMIGRGEDHDYLVKHVKQAHLEDYVIFVGEVRDRALLQSYYMISDLLVFPSFYDNESLTKIEAAAVKLPTIFAKGSCTAASVVDGVNGYTAEADVNIFANKIINIFKHPAQHKKIGEKAKATLYKTWEDIVVIAEKRYYEVIKKHYERDN